MMTLHDVQDAHVTTYDGRRVTMDDIDSYDFAKPGALDDTDMVECCNFFDVLFDQPNTDVGSLCELRRALIEDYKADVRLGDVYPEDLNHDLMIIGLLDETIKQKGIFA